MKFSGPWKLMPVFFVTLAVLSACGNEKYNKQTVQASAVANQYVTTKPKIDIIVFQDNSDSLMFGPINSLNLQNFVSNLSSNWDYHFTVLPLLSAKSISSKYVIAESCSGISGVNKCLTTSQASQFNTSGDYGWIRTTNSSIGSADKGFQNMQANLTQASLTSSGFLRPDAALAVIVLSNGEDTSGVGYSTRSDGVSYLDYDHPSTIASYNQYKSFFTNFKVTANMSQFYSVVSAYGGTCLGSSSYKGKRYMDMSDDLGSRYYNICNNEINSVMSDISSQLVAVTESVIFNYTVLDRKPLESSIVVRKNGAVVPKSTTNGWSYAGYLTDQPTAYYPTLSNPRTGYMIKLNGSAVYQGSDSITVEYDWQ